jgi:hypothetical protein
MRWHTVWLILAVLLTGCMDRDENPNWDPQSQLPSWTYDAPFYYRPTKDLEPLDTVGNAVNVYYTRDDWFFIPHPANAQPVGEPRVAVWYSTDRGQEWKKAGFFGVEQSHLLFRAEQDADYWIRFVGPGQGATRSAPGMPHRIYVVDRKPPAIMLSLCGEARQRLEQPPFIFQAGEPVTLAWGIHDAHLAADSIELVATGAEFPYNIPLVQLGQPLSDGGSVTVSIPASAARTGGVKFQLRATDKAGNVALATTQTLPTNPEAPAVITRGVRTPWLALPTGPVETGWPLAGEFIRGGQTRTLRWIPEQAQEYGEVNLEFSANDGRDLTWAGVATGLKAGQETQWTAPEITSKSCRLRIVGILPQGQQPPDGPRYEVLAVSPRFTTDTAGIPPATQLGRQ